MTQLTKMNAVMIKELDPKLTTKPIVRCALCDREVTHYNIFVEPPNETINVCWECTQRKEKGFFTHRDFRRSSRSGTIPR